MRDWSALEESQLLNPLCRIIIFKSVAFFGYQMTFYDIFTVVIR